MNKKESANRQIELGEISKVNEEGERKTTVPFREIFEISNLVALRKSLGEKETQKTVLLVRAERFGGGIGLSPLVTPHCCR
ncbi:MAG: hypothetical protein ACFFFG_14165 [Candidatus Thorarchaeota archaeon]